MKLRRIAAALSLAFAVALSIDAAERKKPDLKLVPLAVAPAPDSTANNSSIGADRIDQRGNNHDREYFYERTGMGVTVYVVDTGVNYLNNDFGGRVIPLYDFQRDPSDPNFGLPDDEHGTDVASQVGGTTFGVAKNATMYSVRVFDALNNVGSAQDLINGLEAVRQHILDSNGTRLPAVVNMSIIFPCTGGFFNAQACNSIDAKVQQLVNAGAVVVVGTNNQNQSSFNWSPTRLALQSRANGIICVGGTEVIDNGTTFDDSPYFRSGAPVEIRAPAGHDGFWFQRGLSYDVVYGKGGFLGGNSMATPLVSGAVALYLEQFANSTLPSPGAAEQAILNNATQSVQDGMVYTGCEFLGPYATNPILDTQPFIRQHYLEFLGRQPDTGGFNFWTGVVNGNCPGNAEDCAGRVNLSRAFFESIENKETNFFAYRVHRATFSSFGVTKEDGSFFSTRTNPRMERLFADGRRIGRNVVVGAPNWQAILEANQRAFCDGWVASDEFNNLYPWWMSNDDFVHALYANAQVGFDATGADAVNRLDNGEGRGSVLYSIVTGDAFASSDHVAHPDTVLNLWNPMYVLLCYMGYLRRNPDDAPDFNSLDGYNFWLNKLNTQTFGGDEEGARNEMVKAFIVSIEYKARFFADPHCGQPAP